MKFLRARLQSGQIKALLRQQSLLLALKKVKESQNVSTRQVLVIPMMLQSHVVCW
jgi:hypothetical protein